MISLKTTFARAVIGNTRVSLFVLTLMMLAIDDDRQCRDEEKRKKREREANRTRKRPSAPRPF
jgi:hypothetical protein